ncbi:MAG: hypothetical protein JWO32_1597 [Bacteroidetes bacterium]|nr:hypothetical protein [Bacteroidota bacterium]
MENDQLHLDALQDIRQMMKKSNRFLSLSGLSGIFAGIYALAGAYLGNSIIRDFMNRAYLQGTTRADYRHTILLCAFICITVLILSIFTAILFSGNKAKRHGYKLFDHTAWRLIINMLIPLAAGGMFCIAMLYHNNVYIELIGPAMLIFYGLALVNGSKYTLHDIRYLGCAEITLGLIACFYISYGIVFWAIGFGVLHILYGTYMWFKYDRNLK